MNKFKKITAAALAAALMTGTAVTANAEESQTKLLIAEDFSTENTLICGGGYFHDNDGFFKLGEEELAKWRETGKFTTTSVECNVDLTDFSAWNGSFEDEYLQYAKKDADGNITERKVVHLDKENNKILDAYTLGADWCYTTDDGYTVLEPTTNVENGTVTFTVMKPDGTTFTKTIKSWVAHMDGAQWDDYVWYKYRAVNNGKYCCYIVVDEKPDGSMLDYRTYAIYGIAKDESITKISGGIDALACGSIEYASEENTVVSFASDELGYYCTVFTVDNTMKQTFSFYGSISYTNDKIAIGVELNGYDLIDLSSGEIIANYPKIYGRNEEIYLVQTEDEKWGYIDSNGKELAIFDNASDFLGDFAPVVKDGKAYLIDRNMNKVSEAIDGEAVYAIDEGLYIVTVNGVERFMTYAAKPTASEPTKPTEPTNPTTPSEPVSNPEDTKNPATGTTGIAAAFGVIALAAGAVVVAKKRK